VSTEFVKFVFTGAIEEVGVDGHGCFLKGIVLHLCVVDEAIDDEYRRRLVSRESIMNLQNFLTLASWYSFYEYQEPDSRRPVYS
jgi:hypothetical protein